MKKIYLTALATIIACTTLAGCSDSASTETTLPSQTVQDQQAGGAADKNADGTINNPEAVVVNENDLVFWSLFSGGDGDYMDRIISSYNEDVTEGKVASIMLVWADYYTKLTTAVAANKGPDIGVSHASKLPELVAQGIVAPIDDYAEAAGINWEDYDDGILEAVTFDGQVYAMPLDTHAELMYFNIDLLEAAGIELKDGKIDFGSGAEDFIAVMERLKENLPDGTYPISMPGRGDEPYRIWWASYFQMGGTPLVSEDGTEVTMDPVIAKEAMDFVNTLYVNGYVAPGIDTESFGRYFQSENAATVFAGTWMTGVFEAQEGLDFGVQAYPKVFANDACWADAHTLIIPFSKSRTEEETQQAVNFISYVSSKGGLTWSESGQIPSNNQVLSSAEYKALPYRSYYAAAAGDAVYPSKHESFYTIKDLLIKNLDNVWSGAASAEDVVTSIQEELEMAIQ